MGTTYTLPLIRRRSRQNKCVCTSVCVRVCGCESVCVCVCVCECVCEDVVCIMTEGGRTCTMMMRTMMMSAATCVVQYIAARCNSLTKQCKLLTKE